MNRSSNRWAALATFALLTGGLAACTAAGPPASQPSQPAPSTAPTTPPASIPTSAPASVHASTVGAPCRPEDLDPRPIYGNGAAAGSHGQHVVVRNTSGRPCQFDTFPDLGIPAQRRDGGGQPVVRVAPGEYAGFLVMTVNGYGGYDPTSPACAHPKDYQNLSVVLADGQRYPLPGLHISAKCGDVSIRAWAAVTDVNAEIPNPTRPPA